MKILLLTILSLSVPAMSSQFQLNSIVAKLNCDSFSLSSFSCVRRIDLKPKGGDDDLDFDLIDDKDPEDNDDQT